MGKKGDDAPMLLAQSGALDGQRWLVTNRLLIGRDEDCDIVIPERQVSRHHAEITKTPMGIILEDLSSKNGTHYNGQIIQEKTLLKDGDTIQIALAQSFHFISSDATLPLDGDSLPPLLQPVKLRIDKRARRVWVRDAEIIPPLSASQYRLLEVLYNSPNQIVTRIELIEYIWDDQQTLVVTDQALDALIRRLRERIAEVDAETEYILTVRGHGLRLDNPPIEP